MNKTRLKLPESIRRHKPFVQFLEYFIGSGLMWSGYGVFAICFSVLNLNWLLSKFLGDLVAVTTNYFVQRYWVFDSPMLYKQTGRVSTRYIVVSATDVAIDYLIVVSLHQIFGITVYIGALVAATFFTCWNWLWYKFWVFKPKEKQV